MPRSFGCAQVTLRPPIQISPAVDVEQAGDGIEQRRLAAARRAEQHQEFALLDLEVDVRERGDVLERDRQVAGFDLPLIAVSPSPRRRRCHARTIVRKRSR